MAGSKGKFTSKADLPTAIVEAAREKTPYPMAKFSTDVENPPEELAVHVDAFILVQKVCKLFGAVAPAIQSPRFEL